MLRPVRAGNGFEEALEQILQLLRLGLVAPGERLPSERELSQQLRISRVTLREALKVLQDQGMVESRRGRYGGTFVLPRTATPDAGDELRRRIAAVDVEDTLRFREVLEAGAAGLCAEGLPEDGERRLRVALDATRGARLEDYRRQDTLLHLTLAELYILAPTAMAVTTVRATLNELLDCIPLLVRNLEHSQHQPAAVVQAGLDRHADPPRALMREHRGGTPALLRGFLA